MIKELTLTYLAIHCNMYIDNVFTTFLQSSINTGGYWCLKEWNKNLSVVQSTYKSFIYVLSYFGY